MERVVVRFGGRVSVILFGLRAAGTHSPSSDFDVIIVTDREGRRLLRDCCRDFGDGRGLPIDLLLFGVEEFKPDGVLRS